MTEELKIPIGDKILKVTAVFIPDETMGGYTGFFKELPGCIAEGETVEKTRARLLSTVEDYLLI